MAKQDLEWIKYSPEGRETKYDTKMGLRNMMKCKAIMCPSVPMSRLVVSDFRDDVYSLKIDEKDIIIRAREDGQNNAEEPQLGPGIWFYSQREDKEKIEGLLMKVFG
jgi:hypothetical protein